MQNQSCIERLFLKCRRTFTTQLIEKARCCAEFRNGGNWLKPLTNALKRSDNGGDFCDQSSRFAKVGLYTLIAVIGIVQTEMGNGCAKNCHRVRVFRESFQHLQNWLWQAALAGQFLSERFQFRLGREFTVPKQVDDFLTGVSTIDELVNIIAL